MKAAEYWKRRTVDLEHLLQARTTATMVEVNRMYAQAFEQEKAAFAKKQLETAVAAELLQRKLPAQFAAFLTGNDATASQKNLETFDAAFQEAVQAATTANLRGKDLPPAGKEAAGDNVPPTDFRAYEAWRKQNG